MRQIIFMQISMEYVFGKQFQSASVIEAAVKQNIISHNPDSKKTIIIFTLQQFAYFSEMAPRKCSG